MGQIDFGSSECFIPHSGRSLLLDRIVAHDGETTTTRIVVGGQPWLVRDDGTVGVWMTVEYMAQSVAAHESLLATAENRTLPQGFLMSVLGLRLLVPVLRCGDVLEVVTQRARGRPALGAMSHRCTMSRRDEDGTTTSIADGRLSTSIPAGTSRPSVR